MNQGVCPPLLLGECIWSNVWCYSKHHHCCWVNASGAMCDVTASTTIVAGWIHLAQLAMLQQAPPLLLGECIWHNVRWCSKNHRCFWVNAFGATCDGAASTTIVAGWMHLAQLAMLQQAPPLLQGECIWRNLRCYNKHHHCCRVNASGAMCDVTANMSLMHVIIRSQLISFVVESNTFPATSRKPAFQKVAWVGPHTFDVRSTNHVRTEHTSPVPL